VSCCGHGDETHQHAALTALHCPHYAAMRAQLGVLGDWSVRLGKRKYGVGRNWMMSSSTRRY
jgi:hypothetical protein